MKSHARLFALLMLLIVAVTLSAQTTSKVLSIVPQETSFVMDFHIPTLLTKSQLDKQHFFKEMIKEAQKENKDKAIFLKDLAKTGIDLSESAVLFAREIGETTSMNVALKLKDAKAFRNFVVSMADQHTIIEAGDIAILSLHDSENLVGWTNTHAVIALEPELSDNEEDWKTPDGKLTGPAEVKAKALFADLLKDQNSKSILKNKLYANYAKITKDMGFWVNFRYFDWETSPLPIDDALFNIQEMKNADNCLWGTLIFENGRVVGKVDKKFSPEFDKYVNEHWGPMFKPDFDVAGIEKITPGNPMGILTLSLGMKAILTEIDAVMSKDPETAGSLQFAYAMLSAYGLDKNGLFDLAKGDFLLLLDSVSMKEGSVTPGISFLGVLGNKASGIALLKALSTQGVLMAEGDYYVIPADSMNSIYIGLKDNLLYASMNKGNMVKFLKGQKVFDNAKIDPTMLKDIRENNIYVHVDFQQIYLYLLKISEGLPANTRESFDGLKTLDKLTAKTNLDGGSAVLTLKNTKENSLFILLSEFGESMTDDKEEE